MLDTTKVGELNSSEYAPYFEQYIKLAGSGDVREILSNQIKEIVDFFASVSEDSAETIHEPYSWTIKQVVGHMIDTEKIFGCRAHRIACSDQQPLPGFDQDEFVRNTSYDHVSMVELVSEFASLRDTNLKFFNRLESDSWDKAGNCDGKSISVRAIAYLLVGHFCHHMNIVKQRLS